MRFVKHLIFAAALGASFAAEPAEELATFQIADGFEVNLFASEKDGLIKPIQMRFDARGRLWVIGSSVYPQLEPGQKPNDKVLILEDADGDGRCDKVTTFADGLMIPTGLELTKDGAYIGHGTELLLLRDTNGDDRADERTVVLRGFGTGDNHQNINSFTWGPGGELWMCQGLHIHSHVETPYGIVNLEKAGIWRLWPRRLKLEGFYGSEHEPQNPWGHVFNEFNEHIVLGGNNSSPIFPDVGLVPNRRNDPPPLIWPAGNGRKVSGGDFVANAHFPDDWQGRLILGGYINNAVWSVRILDDGAGFRFEDAPPLIRSTAREFRPVDVKFGPDGALYLCDWYNPIIGHYQASFRHPDRDKTHGRIWRVTAKGRALTPRPKIAGASVEQLLTHLQSNDRWTRQFAKRELSNRTEPLPSVVQFNDRALMDVVGILQAREQPNRELVARLAKSSQPSARAYAAQVAGLWGSRISQPLEILRPLATDPNPRVRLQAIVGCAQVNTPEAIDVVLLAVNQPFDRFLTYAFNQAVHSLKPRWLPRFQRGELQVNSYRLAALVGADATADTLEGLRKFLKSPPFGFLKILAENGTPYDLAAILQQPNEIDPETLGILGTRSIKPSGDLASLLQPLLESSNRGQALQLAGQWKVESLYPVLRQEAKRYPASSRQAESSAGALRGLGAIGKSELSLIRQAATESSDPIRAIAIGEWQKFEPAEAARAAVGFFQESTPTFQELLTVFLQRPESANALADALNGKSIPEYVATTSRAIIARSGRNHEKLAKAFAPAIRRENISDWTAFVNDVRKNGNAKEGEKIFNRADLGCLACHKVNGNEGGVTGPDLSALGTAQPIDFIARAILEPQKEIKEGFTSISISTKTGDEFQGYLMRETKDEIFFRDPLLNQEVRIRRDHIAARRDNGSLMPVGLVDQLSREEFRDLVGFLSNLGKPTNTAP